MRCPDDPLRTAAAGVCDNQELALWLFAVLARLVLLGTEPPVWTVARIAALSLGSVAALWYCLIPRSLADVLTVGVVFAVVAVVPIGDQPR